VKNTAEGSAEGFYLFYFIFGGHVSGCKIIDFCCRVTGYTLSPGGSTIPWSHEPINKPYSFPNIQGGK
jgi:hypothetical protein